MADSSSDQLKCLQCYIDQNEVKVEKKAITDDIIKDMKTFFKKFENFRDSKTVDDEAHNKSLQSFSDRVSHAHTLGLHLETVSSPQKACQVLTKMLPISFQNPKFVSDMMRAVYRCVTMSRVYHRHFYNARKFWDVLFERIFALPEKQFLEGIMVFLTVVCAAFTEDTKQICNGKYIIEVDQYLYLGGEFHPDKMFPIFKKLYELEGKIKLSSKEFDYKKIVCPLFAPAVAEKEWYSLKDKHPVDFIALLTHLSLTRPILIDVLLLSDAGIPILMELLANKSCQRMHSSLLFSIDALMSIDTTDSRFELLRKLLDQLDYKLLLKFAVHDDVGYRRALAQKIILHTIRFLDIARKSGFVFGRPKREDLVQVEYHKLKQMISKGGLDDKIFAFIVATERIEEGKEKIIEEKFQDYALCVLRTFDENFSHCRKETKDQLISCALNLLVAIGPLDEDECPSLFKGNTVEVFSKFYNYDEKDIKLLSRVNTVNICQTSFDKKLELFRLIPITTWGEEIYELHHKRRCMNKNLYSQLMPVTVKLIHYDLCILYHMKKSGVLDELNGERMRLFHKLKPETFRNMCVYVNGENWTKMLDYAKFDGLKKETCGVSQSVADKIMEVLVETVFDKNMPDRYNTIAVACMAHLMNTDELDVSRHISRSLVAAVKDMYDDEANRFYLSDGGDFIGAFKRTSSSLTRSIRDTTKTITTGASATKENSSKRPSKPTSCSGIRDKKLLEKLHANMPSPADILKENQRRHPNLTRQHQQQQKQQKQQLQQQKQQQHQQKQQQQPLQPAKKKSSEIVAKKVESKSTEESSLKEKKTKKVKTCALPSCGTVETDKKFKKCGRCRQVTYCDRECQTNHWAQHKKVCQEVSP